MGKKILCQIHEGNISGANLCFIEYADILLAHNFQMHVIMPAGGSMEDHLKKRNISYSIIPSYSWASTRKIPFSLKEYLKKCARKIKSQFDTTRLIKHFKPDFAVTNSIANPTLAFAAYSNKIKHLWFVHEFGEEDHGFIIAGKAAKGKRLISKLSMRVVYNSQIVQYLYDKYVDPKKSCLVRYVIELPRLVKSVKKIEVDFKFIMLGQIAPSKNHLEALKALNICIKKGLSTSLTIVGNKDNSDYWKVLQEYIETERLQDHITFSGPTNTPLKFLIESHSLLMCSRMEAFGRVTVEALKCGIPVIAADKGGSLEIINDGENGIFYKEGNANDLARSMTYLIEHYESFDSIKIQADAYERFNIQNTSKQLLPLFN